jgi:flagellum-specific ATP synthase
VLVEGDDMNEPIADAVRGILDGHIVMSRALANSNHYPAIDVLDSVSRLSRDICSPAELDVVSKARESMAVYRRNEDLITIGAYPKNSNPAVDRAIALREPITRFLRQSVTELAKRGDAFAALKGIVG